MRLMWQALGLVLLGAVGVWAQVIAPGSEDETVFNTRPAYPAYAMQRYVSYDAVVPARGAVYDRLGQFVSYGSYGLRWNEVRDRYTRQKEEAGLGLGSLSGGSDVLQQSNFFNFLAVVRQNYDQQYMSMAVGRNLAASFTPLVLSHISYGGLRVDYATPRQDLTFLLSRGGSMESSLLFSRLRGDERGFEELSPVIVGGGNWRGHFGALDIGASFFRQVQSNVKSKPVSLVRGDVPYPEIRSPKVLKVRVSDDSPRDLQAAAYYGASVAVKGLVDSVAVYYTGSRQRAQGSRYEYRAGMEAVIEEGRQVDGHYEASGPDERIIVSFDLQSLYAAQPGLVVVDADIEVLVEGDYRIGMRQLYDFSFTDPNTGVTSVDQRSWPFTPEAGDQSIDQFSDYLGQDETFFTVRRSEDGPRIGEGPVAVRFKHAIPTAQTFYSVNINLLTERFHLNGEFVLNPQDFKFPTAAGKRQSEMAKAGYMTLKGRMGVLGTVGAEVFHLEPTYGGWYDSRRGGLVLHTDVRERAAGITNRSITQEFRTYDDNDDHDNWPDDYPGSADILYMPRGNFERPTFPSSRPEGGVYPGLDRNGDLILDHDRNRNAVDDYLEPFYGYDSDPPEFVYGLDLNNNLVPDFRENDDEPDYPYRRDQRGAHLYYDLTTKPWWLRLARLGWYRADEIAGGHKMSSFYGRVGLRAEMPRLWLDLSNDFKRVRDDIADDVYRVVPILVLGANPTLEETQANQRFNQPSPPPQDALPMRNSLANTSYLESRWLPLAGVQVVNTFKYVLNRKMTDKAGGTVLQKDETLHNFSMVNKASYSRMLLPKLELTARIKHLWAKWDENSYVPVDTLGTYTYLKRTPLPDGSVRLDTVSTPENEASWSLVTPELVLSYALTPQTRIEYGQHGLFLPMLHSRFTDRQVAANSFDQRVSLLQFSMLGEYGGYRMVSSVGLRWEKVDYHQRSLKEDIDFTSFFVDVIFSPE
jgi:hypothetical protein